MHKDSSGCLKSYNGDETYTLVPHDLITLLIVTVRDVIKSHGGGHIEFSDFTRSIERVIAEIAIEENSLIRLEDDVKEIQNALNYDNYSFDHFITCVYNRDILYNDSLPIGTKERNFDVMNEVFDLMYDMCSDLRNLVHMTLSFVMNGKRPMSDRTRTLTANIVTLSDDIDKNLESVKYFIHFSNRSYGK